MADATPSTKSSTKTTPRIIHPRREPFEHGILPHTEAHLHRAHPNPTLPQANPIPPSPRACLVRGPPDPPNHARLIVDTIAVIHYSDCDIEAGGGVDVCVLIQFLYVQLYKRLLPRTHKDSATVVDVWSSTSAFDGYLSALSPLQNPKKLPCHELNCDLSELTHKPPLVDLRHLLCLSIWMDQRILDH
ncbi:hypothetical protein RHMOL_Rhmol11G0107900 [Rhododendron molle]|uniref:Uncharacterized protein n=1 Tax=Rhododendron molle TaxID=49168 RepID=A0ACC0LSF5_RHOML|nr:hypothetical protein RHMOL_Rhmol11G0107900 [Rhododendron molle]